MEVALSCGMRCVFDDDRLAAVSIEYSPSEEPYFIELTVADKSPLPSDSLKPYRSR